MPNLLPEFLPRVATYSLPLLEAGNDIVFPNFGGYSLANLPASICRWLGAPAFGAPPLADDLLTQVGGPFRHVILMVVDGMGLKQFQRVVQPEREKTLGASIWARLAPEAILAPLTSVVPSTTSAALTTLWTGRYPGQHGIVGYEVWLKEYGVIANLIFHSPSTFFGDLGSLKKAGFQPETFLPVPTIGPHLAQNGVGVYAFMHHSIARSGLSTMHLPGSNVIPYRTLSDLWVTLSELLDAHSSERTYSYLYWGDVDELSHRFGPENERVSLEFASFSLLLERFISSLKLKGRKNTLFIMTADHGQIFTPHNPDFDLKNHPEFVRCLVMMPSGEGRLSYVFLRSGRESQAQQYIEQAWPGQFRILPSELVLRAGLLGPAPLHPRLADRIGDWVVVPQGSAYWWWADKENPLLGRHGGLSPAEMLVPFLAFIL